jgi:hypothetical protein
MVIKFKRVLSNKLVNIDVTINYTKKPILRTANIWLAADASSRYQIYNQEIYGRLCMA